MNLARSLFALAIVAAAGACDGAPTVPASAEGAGPATTLNQAPVANIRLVHKKPMANDPYGIDWFFRFDFDAGGSYDPEGGTVTYRWSSSCYYVANGYAYTYRVDVQPDDTCVVDLYVIDAQGAEGHDQVTVNSSGDIYY